MYIYVYRLAIDARPKWGDDVTARKYPSLLEDFQTAATSMDRQRHLASTARGLYCFCIAPSTHKQIRSIRSIRVRIETSRGENGLSMFIALARMVTLGMKVMV